MLPNSLWAGAHSHFQNPLENCAIKGTACMWRLSAPGDQASYQMVAWHHAPEETPVSTSGPNAPSTPGSYALHLGSGCSLCVCGCRQQQPCVGRQRRESVHLAPLRGRPPPRRRLGWACTRALVQRCSLAWRFRADGIRSTGPLIKSTSASSASGKWTVSMKMPPADVCGTTIDSATIGCVPLQLDSTTTALGEGRPGLSSQ